jgi:hypothetical protein
MGLTSILEMLAARAAMVTSPVSDPEYDPETGLNAAGMTRQQQAAYI